MASTSFRLASRLFLKLMLRQTNFHLFRHIQPPKSLLRHDEHLPDYRRRMLYLHIPPGSIHLQSWCCKGRFSLLLNDQLIHDLCVITIQTTA